MPSKAKLRGFSKIKSTPPDKKTLKKFGGSPPKATGFDIPGDRGFGMKTPVVSVEKATAAMQGMGPPKMGKTNTRKDSRKQFKPKGKKVF